MTDNIDDFDKTKSWMDPEHNMITTRFVDDNDPNNPYKKKAEVNTDTVVDEYNKELQRIQHEKEIKLHNDKIDYAKAAKKRKPHSAELLKWQQSVVEELVTDWAKRSIAMRIPTMVQSGIALQIAQFFKANVMMVPNPPTYDEMGQFYLDVSQYLSNFDKQVFEFLRKSIAPEKLISTTYEKANNSIHAMFEHDRIFFFGYNVWAGMIVSNEKILNDPRMEMTTEHAELVLGKVGKFRGTSFITDGFAPESMRCMELNEAYFIDIPFIQTKSQPKLVANISVDKELQTDKWYEKMKFEIPESGADYVKAYCRRVIFSD